MLLLSLVVVVARSNVSPEPSGTMPVSRVVDAEFTVCPVVDEKTRTAADVLLTIVGADFSVDAGILVSHDSDVGNANECGKSSEQPVL